MSNIWKEKITGKKSTKEYVSLFALGIIIFFFLGLGRGIFLISANQYFKHKLANLVPLTFQNSINKSIIILLEILVIFFFLVLIKKLIIWTVKKFLGMEVVDEKKFHIFLLSTLLYIGILIQIIRLYLPVLVELIRENFVSTFYFLYYIKSNIFSFMLIFLVLLLTSLLLLFSLTWIGSRIDYQRFQKIISKGKTSHFLKIFASTVVGIWIILNITVSVYTSSHVPRNNPNVIFILVDALRKDHVGLYGYDRNTTPNIDNFSQDTVVFTKAISQSSWTIPAVASLFTALFPSVHGTISHTENKLNVLDRKLVTMAEVLKNHGYSTGAFVANHWFSSKTQFYQGFDVFDEINIKTKPLADEVNEKAIKWLKKVKNRPFFIYLHYQDAHAPYKAPESFSSFLKSETERILNEDEIAAMGIHFTGNMDLNYYIDNYDGGIRYFDYHFGHLFEYLKGQNLYDKSVIVFTADHGEAFFEHGDIGHGDYLFDEMIRVPLLIKFHDERNNLDLDNKHYEMGIELIDITSTILQLLGYDFPYPVNGESIFQKERDLRCFSELEKPKMSQVAMIKGGKKALYDRDKKKIIGLYDLNKDPSERVNLSGIEEEKILSSLRKEIESWILEREQERIKRGMDHRGKVEMDEDQKEQLKALGYIK